MSNVHVCFPPPPNYNANTTARSQLRAFSLGVFKSSARSSFCGGGILHCKILISPRPLTTPRCVFAIKPKHQCAELLLLNIACQRRIRAGTPRPVFVVANSILCAEFSPCGFRACLFSQAPRATPRCVFVVKPTKRNMHASTGTRTTPRHTPTHIAIITKQHIRHKRQTKSAHHYFEPLVNWSAAEKNVCDFCCDV